MSEIKKSFAGVRGVNKILPIALFLLTSISSPMPSAAQLDNSDFNSGHVTNAMGSIAVKTQPTADGRPAISVNQLGAPDKARNALQKALEAWRKNRPSDADAYAAEALAVYPRYAVALTVRGILKAESDPRQACEYLQKAIAYDPNYGPAYLTLGSAYNRLGQFDDAARTLDRGIAIAPAFWQGYYELSVASLGKGDFKAALRLVEKVSSLVPMELPLVHLVKGYAFVGLQNRPAATAELTTFLIEAPDDPLASRARHVLEKLAAPLAGQ
jgi:tetratricopeptide (TPR) repeat protein